VPAMFYSAALTPYGDQLLPHCTCKDSKYFALNEEIERKSLDFKEKNLYLQCERRNQVEPRCAERWHLRDDEQFDLAAWFLSL